ncbi:MAG TPA: RNA-binding S4 domain-containing protein [Bacteroidetes bacterium]|nr:RNA-binding S4 domain-containing protein [Bacteroidota bacterium]
MAKAHRELPGEMRIDKWLKTVRIFKKREEAATACELGRVKLNGQVAKASRPVKAGDKITVKVNKTYRELEVLQIPVRGLSARDAKLAYDEKTPELSEEAKLLLKMQQEAERKNKRKFKGRPTKKERRDLGKLRGL